MKKLVILFCCIAALVSCKKSGDKACNGLVAPINAPQNVNPIYVPFNWLNCSTMPSDFVLSAHRDYSNPIMSKEIFTTSLKADTILYPQTKYYWIVTVKDQQQSYQDSFTTSNVSGIIAGNYSGTGRNNNYGLVHDTTYAYSLAVTDAGNDIISLRLPNIDSVTFLKIATTDTTIVYTCSPCTGKYNGFKNLVYFPVTSSIVITFQTAGANYDEWDFTGSK